MSTKTKLNERGMVSIIVTMVMMIVITLIVLGFAQVARHNEREALDRQLSTQAFYAAESGINDVLNLIPSIYNASDTTNYNSCDPNSSSNFMKKATYAGHLQPTLDPATSTAAYTCLLVNPLVPTIQEDNVTPGSSIVVPVHMSAGAPLTFTWTSSDGNSGDATRCPTNGAATNNFVPQPNWDTVANPCKFAILRVDLFDETLNGGSTDPNTMANSTEALYIVPSSSSTSAKNFGGAAVIKANCTSGTCTATLTATDLNGHSNFDVRLSTIYLPAPLVTVGSTSNITFKDAQLLIDATGRAQDQIKRIQVRIPYNKTLQSVPGFGVASGKSLCKQFHIFGSGHTASDDLYPIESQATIIQELCSDTD